MGYRHIDTAQMYGNEAGRRRAQSRPRASRARSCAITTKLNNGFHRPDDARRTFAESLDRLGLDQVDLFLIHWPLPTRYDGDFVSTWRTLDRAPRRRPRPLDRRLQLRARPPEADRRGDRRRPAVNQIEVHPFFTNEAARAADASYGVVTEAWAPIARGQVNDDATIRRSPQRLGRTPSQVALRWHIQRGDIVFPKSTHRERMEENFAIFDFELGADDLAAISALDRGEAGRTGPHPNTMDWLG